MRVLVIGSTGFIGFPVAQALVRAGHQVYGLTRSEAKVNMLKSEEIIPIVGDVSSPEQWINIVQNLDCVADTSGGDAHALLVALSPTRPTDSWPKLSYIYTSGTWVHGEDRENIVTDTSPITHPAALVAWRPPVEQDVLAHAARSCLNTMVIRPALLYGRGASLLAPIFEAASKGEEIVWPGTPGGRFSLIHADDLADLYVRVVEGAAIAGGKIFDAANGVSESQEDVLAKLVKVSGAKGYRLRDPETPYEVALSSTSIVRPYLGKALLGWEPKKMGLVDGLATYYEAWKATSKSA